MSPPGEDDLAISIRSALLDALEALEDHRDALVLIGAQAIYLRVGAITVALPEFTKDTDLVVDTRLLDPDPTLDQALIDAGFYQDASGQPGAWLSSKGAPVDLMAPELLAGPSGSQRRGARISPHSKRAMRRAAGLEAAVVDHSPITIRGLVRDDDREYEVEVASSTALLVAKLHKLGERNVRAPHRVETKDAHDAYRLLVGVETDVFEEGFVRLLRDEVAAEAAATAAGYLEDLFGSDSSPGAQLAGEAEAQGIGEPATVAAAASALARDLLNRIPSD